LPRGLNPAKSSLVYMDLSQPRLRFHLANRVWLEMTRTSNPHPKVRSAAFASLPSGCESATLLAFFARVPEILPLTSVWFRGRIPRRTSVPRGIQPASRIGRCTDRHTLLIGQLRRTAHDETSLRACPS